jgi:hypothetical protein
MFHFVVSAPHPRPFASNLGRHAIVTRRVILGEWQLRYICFSSHVSILQLTNYWNAY